LKKRTLTGLPKLRGVARRKPLGYNPETWEFVYYDDIIKKRASIVPLEQLTPDQAKKLVVERNRIEAKAEVQVLSGKRYTQDQVNREIMADTEFGRMALKAEMDYLAEMLRDTAVHSKKQTVCKHVF